MAIYEEGGGRRENLPSCLYAVRYKVKVEFNYYSSNSKDKERTIFFTAHTDGFFIYITAAPNFNTQVFLEVTMAPSNLIGVLAAAWKRWKWKLPRPARVRKEIFILV